MRRFISWAVSAALLCTLAACSPSTLESPSPSPTITLPPTPLTTLRVPMPDAPDTFNPLMTTQRDMHNLLMLCFESLTFVDSQGEAKGELAEGWKVDSTGKTWTFTLRQGLRWQDGESLTAQDVAFTLETLKLLDTSRYFRVISKLESFQVKDELNLVCNLKEPYPLLAELMNFPVLPEHYYASRLQSPFTLPMGSGPYQAVSLNADQGLHLKANTLWWKKSPVIRTVDAKTYATTQAALEGFMRGEVDVLQTLNLASQAYRETNGAHLYEMATAQYDMLWFNHKLPALQSLSVRKAVSMAVSAKQVITRVYLNHALAAETPVISGGRLAAQSTQTEAYNLQAAKAALTEAGYADSDGDGFVEKNGQRFELKLLTNDDLADNSRREAALLLRDQLRAAGIYVTVTAKPWDEFILDVTARKFDLLLCSVAEDAGADIAALLQKDSPLNPGDYDNESAQALVAEGKTYFAWDAYADWHQRVQAHIREQLPFVGLYFRTCSLLTVGTLQGVSAVQEQSPYRGIENWKLYP